MVSSKSDVVEISPLEIDSRVINSVVVSDGVVRKIGARNKRQIALFIARKISRSRRGSPRNYKGDKIKDPIFSSREDFYYEIQEEFEERDFIFLIKVAIEGRLQGSREHQGCILHIIDVEFILKEVL